MLLNTSIRSAKPCRPPEAGCQPRGLRECGTDSNTRDPSACSSTWPGWPRAIPVPLSRRNWRIWEIREAHMHYPTYQAAGWPIGSGSVESANKVVVEARLKGAGMRLRTAQCQSHARAAQCCLQSTLERDVAGCQEAAAAESPTTAR